ncbi:unnamed protein product [Effrenium voratum]|nr:unnamed protein product [Effrenium voratum]
MLRRFLLQAQHLAVTHRQELLRTLQASERKQGDGHAPLPLIWVPRSPQFDAALLGLAQLAGVQALLQTDSGHCLASKVAKQFPEIWAQQDEAMRFAAYPRLVREEQPGLPTSPEVHLLEDRWLDCVPLQPKVSLLMQEQRAVMGAAEGPMTEAGAALRRELDFLGADVRQAEERISELASRRAAVPLPDAARIAAAEADQEPEGLEEVPLHLTRSFLLLRHLRCRSLRRQLLGLLNLFRFAQQKASQGVLLLQASASGRGRQDSAKQDGKQDEACDARGARDGLCAGELPPSFPLAPLSRRGLRGPLLREALTRLSETEYLLPGAGEDPEEVMDGGLKILHGAALSDLEMVEKELLIIAGYAVEKAPEATKPLVDTAGLLAEVLQCEVALSRAKWRVVKLQLRAFEQVSKGKWDIAQQMVDVMARRPCFDLGEGFSISAAYGALESALCEREKLLRMLLEHQVRTEALSCRRLRRQELLALRCGRRLELDLGHQRERVRDARENPQPTPLAGAEIQEDPQLALEDLMHPMEGLPPSSEEVKLEASLADEFGDSLLDFCDSCSLACEVEPLVEAAALQLVDLAPAPRLRHLWERACCVVLAREWQLLLGQAAQAMPGVAGTQTGIPEANASPIFWGDLADDPNWLLLQTEEVIQSWQEAEEGEAPAGPRRSKDPELAWAPRNEAVLRLSCRLLDQVRLRRQLLDALCEVRILEAGLARQAQLVGNVDNSRVSETLADLSSDFGLELGSGKGGLAPLWAAEAMSCFSHLDFATGVGVRTLLQADQMHELRGILQHQVAGKWLLVGCLRHNAVLCDGLLISRERERVSRAAAAGLSVSGFKAAGPSLAHLCCWSRLSRPWPQRGGPESRPPSQEPDKAKLAAKSLQWPGAVRSAIYTQVSATVREVVRGKGRQLENLAGASKMSCLSIYRCRSLSYSSLFMLERACDLCLRVQASEACGELRRMAQTLPPEISPFTCSREGRRRMLVESDGSLQSIFNVPMVEEVLALRGTDCPSIGRYVRDCEVNMPEPFPQLIEVEEAETKVIPRGHPVPAPQIVVGSPSSAWAQPKVELSFTGNAVSSMSLLHELLGIVGLSIFAAAMSADQILVLRLLHAVEAARGDEQQRAASEAVLSQSMLGTTQIESCERQQQPRSLEQQTWDALEHVRADFLELEGQVKALREEKHQVKPVLRLLGRQRRCLELQTLVLCRATALEAVQRSWHWEAAELMRWAMHFEGFPLEGGSRLVLAAGAVPGIFEAKDFPLLTQIMAGEVPEVPRALTEHEARADEALERLWMSAPRQGTAQMDEVQLAEATALPCFRPEECSHLHPLFHVLCLLFRPPSWSQGELSTSLRAGSSSAARALCLLPTRSRRLVAERHLRMEEASDLIGRGDSDAQEEAESLIQTLYAVQRLQEMAKTFLLLTPPVQTPEGFGQAEALLGRELRCREEEELRKATEDNEPSEELKEGSHTVEELKAKQAQMHLEMAIKVAGEAAAAAEAAADFEGDWLIMAKGGPGAATEQEAGRIAAKRSLIEGHDSAVVLVGIIVKCGLRFAAAAVERLKHHMETRLESEGGKAVANFGQHLLARANYVQTFCKDGQHAWIIKHSDLEESMQEIGRRMLQWAIVTTADQVASARERVALKAEEVRAYEEKLLKVRLALWHQRRDVKSMLNTMVSDRVQRELFEVDRLHRSHRGITSAAYEVEHRRDAEVREELIEELGNLDASLTRAQSCFKEYRKDMLQAVQQEMQKLKQSMMTQLQNRLPMQTLAVQNALKKFERESVEESQALRPPEPVQPQSVASAPVRTETGPETFLEAETIGPGEPAMQPGAQVQRKAALEEMHREIGQLMAAGNRIHTFYDLKCQQLREYYDEELHRVSVALSSNREVWEGVSEARERQRLLSEEIQRSARRCDEAKSEARHMQKAIDEHEEFTKKMFDWKKKMLKAQGDLQHEMRKYERDGLVDVSKMESELGKLDTQLQQLSTSVPAEQLVALLWRRGRGERLRLRRVMHHEGKLLHKAAAKVQVIRTELEKGVQELEDEPFSELLMEECETLSRKIMKLDQENLELQDQILKTGGEVDLVQHPRPSEPRPMLPMSLPKPRRSDPEMDSSFEQDLCFSVSFMKPPRSTGRVRKQIDHSHGGDMAEVQQVLAPARPSESLRHSGLATARTPRKHLSGMTPFR